MTLRVLIGSTLRSVLLTSLAAIFLALSYPRLAGAQDDLVGAILDSRTGDPISLVAVLVDSTLACRSEENGVFRISGLSPGRHLLTFSHVSYKSREMEIVWPRPMTKLVVNLEPIVFLVPEVPVTGELVDPSLPVHQTTLTPEVIGTSAGNIANDPLRTIQSQPGCTVIVSISSLFRSPSLDDHHVRKDIRGGRSFLEIHVPHSIGKRDSKGGTSSC